MKVNTNKLWFDSKEFETNYHTEVPLGAFCSESGTCFRLWAPTAQQVANAGVADAIVDAMEDGVLYTITDLIKQVPACAELTNQRVSAIVRGMIGTKVERVEEKRKAYFRKIAE